VLGLQVAITLLYHLGEGASEESLKPGTGAIAQLAAGLMRTDVPRAEHRLVALARLETFVRYAKMLQVPCNCASGQHVDMTSRVHQAMPQSVCLCCLAGRHRRSLMCLASEHIPVGTHRTLWPSICFAT